MSTRANYYKIGVFVIAGLTILVIGIVILGAGKIFRKRMQMETYINESVQGLDVGSPVKFLGVQIGNVRQITLVEAVYTTTHHYVYVGMDLYPDVFGNLSDAAMRERLSTEAGKGLRVRLASQGLTGAAYIELDYQDPERNPPLPIDWDPKYYYLPSAPSIISRVTESVDTVFRRLEQVHVEQVVEDLDKFLVMLTESVKEAKVAEVREETVGLLESLRVSADRIQELVGRKDLDSIPGDASAMVSSARRLTESTERSLEDILVDLKSVSEKLDSMTQQVESLAQSDEVRQGLTDFADTTRNVKAASETLPETAERLGDAIRRIDDLVARQQRDLEAVLDNLRAVTLNLRELTDEARQYPSGVLFGAPPKPPEVVK